MRNYITRAVGTEEDVEIDLSSPDRKQGDRWLICSDGLYGMISRSELIRLTATEDLEEAAESLLQAALEAGGRDNISLVLIQDNTPEKEKDTADTDGETPEEVDPQ